ncbi:MAG: amidohydrolase [Planctomycetes bacterium]|nr:amidohydrolase [Planctomycetota bacterium]
MSGGFALTAADAACWRDELEDFVPPRVFDAHAHLRNEAFMAPGVPASNDWRSAETSFATLQGISAALFPGRAVRHFAFPLPLRGVDALGISAWAAGAVAADPCSRAAAQLLPEGDAAALARLIAGQANLVALKPYHALCARRPVRIADYLPLPALALADRLGLAVILHLPAGLAPDAAELRRLCGDFPRVRWILAHCAGAFDATALAAALAATRGLAAVWLDTAAICDPRTLVIALQGFDRARILFGTDNALGIGGCRWRKGACAGAMPSCAPCARPAGKRA